MLTDAGRCPFCGRAAGYIYVTSHYQCAACGQVVEPCCTGEVWAPGGEEPTGGGECRRADGSGSAADAGEPPRSR